MASKTERQPVVPGGLNLLSPGDRIQVGGSLLLDNFRPDQNGELRSRKGTGVEAAAIGSGIFHTLTRRGNDRYCGIGADLFWGPSAGTLVKGGFDGNPLGIAFYQSSAWVMNRNQQLRVVGSSSQRWGVDAPASAPTAAAGAQQTITIENWDSLSEPVAGVDVGYTDADGIFHDDPSETTITSDQGTVTVSTGFTAVLGTGTAFTPDMVGQTIEIVTTALDGSVALFGNLVASVTDATHLDMETPFGEFNAGGGLAYRIETQAAAAAADTVNVRSGAASLKVNAFTPGAWYVTDNLITEGTAPIDTRAGGVANDDDYFAIWIYCTNPAAVSAFTVVLVSGAGETPETTAYAALPGSALNQLPNSWSHVLILRSVNQDAWLARIAAASSLSGPAGQQVESDPQALADVTAQYNDRLAAPHFTTVINGIVFTGLAKDQLGDYNLSSTTTAIDWSAISALQVILATTAPLVFNLDFAYFNSTVDGPLTGSGTYFVSFANASNEDGNISPASNTVVCQGQSVALTGVPVSPDPQVTQRWIWRVGFGSSQALLVGQISDNATTTFTDSLSVNLAQDQGLVAPTNRTLPPPARGVMGPYLSQLIAFNTDEHPCRYYWTPSGIPWCFPGADDEPTGNWEDAGSDDDALVAITNHQLMALFYKQRSLGRLYGSPDDADYQQVDSTVGLVGPSAVVNGGQVDYFMGPEGIYYRNYDTKTKISGDIDPIFKGDYVQLSSGEFIPPISQALIGSSVLELCNDRLYVSYVEQGTSLQSVVLICQLPGATAITEVPSYRWSRMKLNPAVFGGAGGVGFSALHYEGGPYLLMGGVTSPWAVPPSGYLLHLEFGDSTDNGESIHVAWQSRFSDQGLPDNYKRYSDLELDFQTAFNGDGLSTLSVYIVYDNGTKVLLGTCNSAARVTQIFTLMGIVGTVQHPQGYSPYEDLRAKNASIRVEGDIDCTCIIYGAYLHWYPEERVATTFDTGFIDLGAPERVKQADYLELYATGTGQQVTRALYSDLPGSVLTVQASLAITLPNGKGNVRARLPAILEGRNLRMVLSNPLNSQAFQIHAARLRQRVIGEYIDGTIGEYYESPEFSAAPGRTGELKDLLLDYDSVNAGGQVLLYADTNPPEAGSPALAVVRTLALPAGTRRTFAFAFEDGQTNLPYGTLFKVRVVPPVGGIVRLHGRAAIRARIIGTCFDGSTGEVWLTQPMDLFGGMGVFREVAVVAQTQGPMTFTMLTELPGAVMAQVASFPVASTTALGRLPVYARLPGNTKGQLQQFKLAGPYWARLFEVKVLGRGLGNSETAWQWVNVPLDGTSNEWQEIQMPVRSTPEEFTWVELPVDAIE